MDYKIKPDGKMSLGEKTADFTPGENHQHFSYI